MTVAVIRARDVRISGMFVFTSASSRRVRVAPLGVERQDHLSLVPGRHAATEG